MAKILMIIQCDMEIGGERWFSRDIIAETPENVSLYIQPCIYNIILSTDLSGKELHSVTCLMGA